jgi:hypothetical protein
MQRNSTILDIRFVTISLSSCLSRLSSRSHFGLCTREVVSRRSPNTAHAHTGGQDVLVCCRGVAVVDVDLSVHSSLTRAVRAFLQDRLLARVALRGSPL